MPVYLKAFYWDDPTLYRSPTAFTIHNLMYQGNFAPDTSAMLGLPGHLGLDFHGQASYMKGGIAYSEMLNTVSPTHAQEIQRDDMGYGFGGLLRSREKTNGGRKRRVYRATPAE